MTCSFLKAKHFYSSVDLTNLAIVIKSQNSACCLDGIVTWAGLFGLLYLQSDVHSFPLHIKHFIGVCRTSVWFSAFRKATVQEVILCCY